CSAGVSSLWIGRASLSKKTILLRMLIGSSCTTTRVARDPLTTFQYGTISPLGGRAMTVLCVCPREKGFQDTARLGAIGVHAPALGLEKTDGRLKKRFDFRVQVEEGDS